MKKHIINGMFLIAWVIIFIVTYNHLNNIQEKAHAGFHWDYNSTDGVMKDPKMALCQIANNKIILIKINKEKNVSEEDVDQILLEQLNQILDSENCEEYKWQYGDSNLLIINREKREEYSK